METAGNSIQSRVDGDSLGVRIQRETAYDHQVNGKYFKRIIYNLKVKRRRQAPCRIVGLMMVNVAKPCITLNIGIRGYKFYFPRGIHARGIRVPVHAMRLGVGLAQSNVVVAALDGR